VGQDSSVSIATRYGMDGPGIQTGPGAHPASYTMGIGSFKSVKWPGHSVDHPPPSSAKVKERVELCLYSPSWPLRPALGRTLQLPRRYKIKLPLRLTNPPVPSAFCNRLGFKMASPLVGVFLPDNYSGHLAK
jgi:hypothetical protein